MNIKTNNEYIKMYENYKKILANKISEMANYNIRNNDQYNDLFYKKELISIYDKLIESFSDIDFRNFTSIELEKLDFKWVDADLICMPEYALDCLKNGYEIKSIFDKWIIINESTVLSRETRYGITSYGFDKSALRNNTINNILNNG